MGQNHVFKIKEQVYFSRFLILIQGREIKELGLRKRELKHVGNEAISRL